eukprot:TRINITY_DN39811_c0_g5_i1.p1 TRINITY_DN39811_c0_g5~~TRINITY_DN39811_c0_g5_i1.p1  ORF type:complete len:799 (+),score=188.52 TRINITY_DN39811_c0_g5_i1:94-2490(+)
MSTSSGDNLEACLLARSIIDGLDGSAGPSDEQVLSVLEKMTVPRNKTRQNVLRGNDPLFCETLGIVPVPGKPSVMAARTTSCLDVCRLLSRWVGAAVPGAVFTSISIAKGYSMGRHRDRSNDGPSIFRALTRRPLEDGSNEGFLRHWPTDSRRVRVDKLPDTEAQEDSSYAAFLVLDGQNAHEVVPLAKSNDSLHDSSRFGIVFFTTDSWRDPAHNVSSLTQAGFLWPSVAAMARLSSQLGGKFPPIAATAGQCGTPADQEHAAVEPQVKVNAAGPDCLALPQEVGSPVVETVTLTGFTGDMNGVYVRGRGENTKIGGQYTYWSAGSGGSSSSASTASSSFFLYYYLMGPGSGVYQICPAAGFQDVMHNKRSGGVAMRKMGSTISNTGGWWQEFQESPCGQGQWRWVFVTHTLSAVPFASSEPPRLALPRPVEVVDLLDDDDEAASPAAQTVTATKKEEKTMAAQPRPPVIIKPAAPQAAASSSSASKPPVAAAQTECVVKKEPEAPEESDDDPFATPPDKDDKTAKEAAAPVEMPWHQNYNIRRPASQAQLHQEQEAVLQQTAALQHMVPIAVAYVQPMSIQLPTQMVGGWPPHQMLPAASIPHVSMGHAQAPQSNPLQMASSASLHVAPAADAAAHGLPQASLPAPMEPAGMAASSSAQGAGPAETAYGMPHEEEAATFDAASQWQRQTPPLAHEMQAPAAPGVASASPPAVAAAATAVEEAAGPAGLKRGAEGDPPMLGACAYASNQQMSGCLKEASSIERKRSKKSKGPRYLALCAVCADWLRENGSLDTSAQQ